MKAIAIIQFLSTGQTNLTITQPPANGDALVLDSYMVGKPDDKDVLVGEVLFLSDDPRIEEALLGQELRGVFNVDDTDPITDYIRRR